MDVDALWSVDGFCTVRQFEAKICKDEVDKCISQQDISQLANTTIIPLRHRHMPSAASLHSEIWRARRKLGLYYFSISWIFRPDRLGRRLPINADMAIENSEDISASCHRIDLFTPHLITIRYVTFLPRLKFPHLMATFIHLQTVNFLSTGGEVGSRKAYQTWFIYQNLTFPKRAFAERVTAKSISLRIGKLVTVTQAAI